MKKKVIPINSQSTSGKETRLTWSSFKAKVEAAGIKETDFIDSIDISWGDPEELSCRKDEEFGWIIKL